MTVIVLFVGLCVGSFFNVLLARYPNFRGVVTGRSHCPHCKRTLAWYELLPIVSFVLQLGRCRTCKKPISLQYPIVELLTGVLLVLFWIVYGTPNSVYETLLLVLVLGFALLAYFDAVTFILPDIVTGALVLVVASVYAFTNPQQFVLGGATGFLMSLPFAILYIVSRGRLIGLGDAKLVFLVGLAFGFPFGVLTVVVAIWTATLLAGLLLLTRRATLKTALPFGVFLSAVAIAYILAAPYVEIFRWTFT